MAAVSSSRYGTPNEAPQLQQCRAMPSVCPCNGTTVRATRPEPAPMIEHLEDLPLGTVAFRFTGAISRAETDNVLLPAIDTAFDQSGRLKALLMFGDDFEGSTLDAASDDTRLGLQHWDGFERIAVVTDLSWLRQSVRLLGLLLPCPVRLFNAEESDQARRWLSEALGTIHLDQHDGLVTMALIGRLDPEAYQRIDDDLANVFSHQAPVRLLLDLRQFDGWQGVGALAEHLALIRQYRAVPRVVAVLADQQWQRAAQRLLGRFSQAQTRSFEGEHLEQAHHWLRSVTV